MGKIVVAQEATALLGALVPTLSSVSRLEAVVLFGSSIDGTFDKRSDIDLLFLFGGQQDPERSSMQSVLAVVAQAKQAASIERDVTPVLARTRANDLEEGFRRNIAKGIVVWARPRLVLGKPDDAGPHVLINYAVKALPANRRGRLQRILYGHTTRKTVKGKTYTHHSKGIVLEHEHVAPSTLIVPQERADLVLSALEEAGAAVTRRDVYLV